MKAKGWGRIINIASAHGLVASPQKVAYVAAKHGVVGMTKVAAIELANTGVTVNAICPGWVLTPLVRKAVARTGRSETAPRSSRRPTLWWPKSSRWRSSPRPEQIGGAGGVPVLGRGERRSPARRCRSMADGWRSNGA